MKTKWTNIIICWMFGEIELSRMELLNYHNNVILATEGEIPDFLKVISGATATAKMDSVREVAKETFISDTKMEM